MLEKIEDKRRRGQQKVRWLDVVTDSMDMSLSQLWETVKDCEAWYTVVHEVCKESDTTERLNNNILNEVTSISSLQHCQSFYYSNEHWELPSGKKSTQYRLNLFSQKSFPHLLSLRTHLCNAVCKQWARRWSISGLSGVEVQSYG